ncbi:hypothetical protein DL770_007275 [Monosporascus sp. CRB-9-2]|nr:hypothetical protein DL770_007275 [Monosporascus sp. CRB-9-2]
MAWLAHLQTAGSAMVWTAKSFLTICYFVTIPLHYPLYYALALVAFLLSPVWYMFNAIASITLLLVDFVTRLKYLYVYFAYAALIGVLAGCVLHGTSSFIFVLLGIDSSSQQERQQQAEERERRRRRQQGLGGFDEEDDIEEEEDAEEQSIEMSSGLWSGDSSTTMGMPSSASSRRRPARGPEKEPALDHRGLLDSQWKLLRATEKPRRRRRGLLSQTIHEESSESDSL